MTLKVISGDGIFDTKFLYHNQDISNMYEITEGAINLWVLDQKKDVNNLLPFTFNIFHITNDEEIEIFRKYIKSIKLGIYVAIVITGAIPYHNKRLYNTFQMMGAGKLIEQISDSNPNYCLIGYKGQRVGFAREIIGDAMDFDENAIQVWTMTSKKRSNTKGRFIINMRNNLPLYKPISDFYKTKIKKEMVTKHW
ncbi:hypothetical protein DICPUDRAFT_43805 [Dictyostelium purpureum]|uniref:ILEI/PANDER domain-containing protein n=1 Tax=Dictyostelium purpureum TaxID=5786 RepID=F1A4U6_DICPU|nr:uncharacterized protein DICPUDRAFT_43805 [Dictyostelium purpureum]EGC28784.1 hypothetical protein DICPUDRAFT_43805 [Dictyostelium purpureum]|eukprot:XP_003294690.1 hypothetical protein DICPUDRAFT_43805 [Dictyostelium purpureum]